MDDVPNRSARTTAVFLMLLVLSSCGGSSQSTSPLTTGSTQTTVTVGLPTTTVPPSTAPSDDAQVRSAFVAFFNGADRNVDQEQAFRRSLPEVVDPTLPSRR